jgi:RNA polymerase sigma factor (sigma-70 family)
MERDVDRQISDWLTAVRREFVRIASRRVNADDVEDVVQEAMRVIAEKGIDRGVRPLEEEMPLAWCFQVLRHTIGNHYQRERTRHRRLEGDPDAVERAHRSGDAMAASLDAMDALTTLTVIESALREMGRTDSRCARYLSRLGDGERAGSIADAEKIERTAFYRRLYRCRQKLRQILTARGVVV